MSFASFSFSIIWYTNFFFADTTSIDSRRRTTRILKKILSRDQIEYIHRIEIIVKVRLPFALLRNNHLFNYIEMNLFTWKIKKSPSSSIDLTHDVVCVFSFFPFHTREFIISSSLSCRSFIHPHTHIFSLHRLKSTEGARVCVCIVTVFGTFFFPLLEDVFFWHRSVNIIFNVHQLLRYVFKWAQI